MDSEPAQLVEMPGEPVAPPAWSSEETAQLFSEVEAFLRRFVIMGDAERTVTSLWIPHTYVFGSFDQTPYLTITSAEKGSGKSTLLDCLEVLASRAERADSVTKSTLIRLIDAHSPTVLLDEADAAFGRGGSYAEDLRCILNAGFRRTGVYRMSENRKTATGETWEPRTFTIFCPKAVAGLGGFPETVTSRSIPIRVKPKLRHEQVASFRWRDAEEEAAPICERLFRWAEGAAESLRSARPKVPAELVNRAADVAEPILAVAATGGAKWLADAEAAVVELLTGDREDERSLGVQLLSDIRRTFTEDRLATADLICRLKAIEESPWGEWHQEWKQMDGITDRVLGRLLRPYGVSSETLRLSPARTSKGYHRKSFDDAFARHLPSVPGNDRNRGNSVEDMASPSDPDVTAVTPVTASEDSISSF